MARTRERSSWEHMKQRCNNLNNERYHQYGGRGISYDPLWESFDNFYHDMGDCPEGCSLDRYPDVDGNYTKDNCRWATNLQQQRNKQDTVYVIHQGARVPLPELAEKVGIEYHVLYGRIFVNNWTVEDAVSKPKRDGVGSRSGVNDTMVYLAANVTHNGKTQVEIGEFLGVKGPFVSNSLNRTRIKLHKLGLDK